MLGGWEREDNELCLGHVVYPGLARAQSCKLELGRKGGIGEG